MLLQWWEKRTCLYTWQAAPFLSVLLHLTKKVLHATKCLLALFWAELFCDTNFLRFSLCLFTGNGPKKGKIIMNIKKESESVSWTGCHNNNYGNGSVAMVMKGESWPVKFNSPFTVFSSLLLVQKAYYYNDRSHSICNTQSIFSERANCLYFICKPIWVF